MKSYDLCVIGAGSGGVRAARLAASLGVKVAVIEQGRFGGTCVNVGCVPKKFCVIASGFKGLFNLAKDYGWDVVDPAFSLQQLKQARDKEILRLNGIYQSLLDNSGVTNYKGRASLLGDGKIAVDRETIQAKKILIATGCRPFIPPEVKNSELALVSDQIFDLDKLPKSLAVYGGGYIAIEFACIFNALGVETHIIYRGDSLLKNFDRETITKATEAFKLHGLNLHLQTTIQSIEKDASFLRLQLHSDEGIKQLATEQLLIATGRVANTENLQLAQAGVETNQAGFIPVSEDYQTSAKGIYALGDISGGAQLTPMATAEAMDFVKKHYQPDSPHQLPNYVATVIFSQPNIATVGLSEEQARKKYDIAVYTSNFKPLQYSLGEDSKERYFVKIIVDKVTDRVIGIHMAGDGSGEIIQGFAAAMEAGISKAELDRTLGIHPTTAEELVSLYQPN